MPTEADAMLHADMLSRVEDSLEIFLSHQAFQNLHFQQTHSYRPNAIDEDEDLRQCLL